MIVVKYKKAQKIIQYQKKKIFQVYALLRKASSLNFLHNTCSSLSLRSIFGISHPSPLFLLNSISHIINTPIHSTYILLYTLYYIHPPLFRFSLPLFLSTYIAITNLTASISSLSIKCVSHLNLFYLVFPTTEVIFLLPLMYSFLIISSVIFITATLILFCIYLSIVGRTDPYIIITGLTTLSYKTYLITYNWDPLSHTLLDTILNISLHTSTNYLMFHIFLETIILM